MLSYLLRILLCYRERLAEPETFHGQTQYTYFFACGYEISHQDTEPILLPEKPRENIE
jgi:hypothetical protein